MSYRLKKGKDRDERANDEYYAGIKEDSLCIYIKICDRISNMSFSKLYGNINDFKCLKFLNALQRIRKVSSFK